jgi:hypothetical protein
MSTGDNGDFVTDVAEEPTDESPTITSAFTAEPETQPIWARRSCLQATALVNKGPGGLRFGPLPAAADDLSTFQCTANDVRIVGPSEVQNEPCDCTCTFWAEVVFTVKNIAVSDRGRITLHLPPSERVCGKG